MPLQLPFAVSSILQASTNNAHEEKRRNCLTGSGDPGRPTAPMFPVSQASLAFRAANRATAMSLFNPSFFRMRSFSSFNCLGRKPNSEWIWLEEYPCPSNEKSSSSLSSRASSDDLRRDASSFERMRASSSGVMSATLIRFADKTKAADAVAAAGARWSGAAFATP